MRARVPRTIRQSRRVKLFTPIWRYAAVAAIFTIVLGSLHTSTSAQADVTPPTVVSRSPAVGGTGVSTQVSLRVTFSEPIAPTTLALTLRAGSTSIAGTLSYDDTTRTATFDPTNDLAGNTLHTAEVVARDVAGNLMPAPVSWTFTTATPTFQQSTVFTGLTQPTVVDSRVMAACSSPRRAASSRSSTISPIPPPTTFADLRTNVYNFYDRGLLGMALHPDFPTTPYVYVLYAHDADDRRHGAAVGNRSEPTSDACPTPPGATGDGCVVSARLSRLTASGQRHDRHRAGARRELVPAVSQPLDRHRSCSAPTARST